MDVKIPQVSANIIQLLDDKIYEINADNLTDVDQQLKKYAQVFLKSVLKMSQEFQLLTDKAEKAKRVAQELKRQLQNNQIVDLKTQGEMDKNKQDFIKIEDNIKKMWRTFFTSVLVFEDNLVYLLTGRPLKMTVVIPDANDAHIIIDLDMEDFLKYANIIPNAESRTHNLSGRLQLTQENIEKLRAVTAKKEKSISLGELSALNNTYSQALRNFELFNPYVRWKPLDAQSWYRINMNKRTADFGQAYATLYYQDQDNSLKLQNMHLYNRLHVFFVKGLSQVDNLAGYYKGDVSDTVYDYAVKTFGGSAPSISGLKTMVKMAQQILSGALDMNKLKEKVKNAQSTNKKTGFQKGLRNFVEKEISENVFKRMNAGSFSALYNSV